MDLTTLERLPLWIGGRTVAAHTTRYGEVTNPATGEVLRHVPLADSDDVNAAAAAALAAWPAWRAAPSLRRARTSMYAAVVDFRTTHTKNSSSTRPRSSETLWSASRSCPPRFVR